MEIFKKSTEIQGTVQKKWREILSPIFHDSLVKSKSPAIFFSVFYSFRDNIDVHCHIIFRAIFCAIAGQRR